MSANKKRLVSHYSSSDDSDSGSDSDTEPPVQPPRNKLVKQVKALETTIADMRAELSSNSERILALEKALAARANNSSEANNSTDDFPSDVESDAGGGDDSSGGGGSSSTQCPGFGETKGKCLEDCGDYPLCFDCNARKQASWPVCGYCLVRKYDPTKRFDKCYNCAQSRKHKGKGKGKKRRRN